MVADGALVPPGRRRYTLIAGRSGSATAVTAPAGLPLPERVTIAEVRMSGWPAFTAVSYYAPPGVSWGLAKPRQAVIVADWLRSRRGPIVLGADANTPERDLLDATAVATHWPTGRRRLAGETGDDVLWGPSVIHGLRDAWRIWLEADPNRTEGIAPLGPLAVSHRTGVRTSRPGTPRRYDSIWVSNGLLVDHASYLSEALDRGLSDHAPVLVDVAYCDAL